MAGSPIDRRIISFINKHHIFTLATSSANSPYTCTCFYVYIESLNLFVFTSDEGTRHVAEMAAQPRVSGAIALETKIIGKIQGIQFTGISTLLEGELYKKSLKAYLKKFPYAGFKELTLWGIEPDFIKMTHNMLGFGTKLTWRKDEN
ncbi:MAG TPA: pyridoxamine 5'-phosphate oxidase family protein [Bacteroidales bacterium]|nr:pyridoxamine 5'-phosphate oxidase family protein [Bacteroidales bacterium]